MIKFCVQMAIKGSREQVWNALMQDFPSDQRHPGKIDLNQFEPKETSAAAQPPTFPDMEILDWKEERGFVVRFSQKPYLKSIVADVWFQDAGGWEGDTIANVRLELTLGCLLSIPAHIIYRVFRNPIQKFVLQPLLEMRYEFETGKKLEPDQEFKLPLDRIQIVRCK
jgi:hypothetical protein